MTDQKLRVLMIEDNPVDVSVVREMLKAKGAAHYEFTSEGTLRGALERLLRKEPFDLILLDLYLPDSSGIATFHSLQQVAARQAIVVITGMDDETIASETLQCGAEDFLVKGRFNASLLMRSAKYAVERKRAEESLKDSEERLKVLFEYAPDGYYLFDKGGTFLDGNKMAESLSGYRKEELIGKSFLKLDLLPLSQMPKAAAILAANVFGKAGGPEEFTLLRKDGTQAEVEIRTYPVKIKGETVILGIARDITERKQSEKDLSASKAKLDLAMRAARMGVWQLDVAGKKRIFDQQTCFLLGIDPATFGGTEEEFFAVVHPEDRERAQKALSHAIDKKASYEIDYRVVRPDGSIRSVMTRGELTRDEQGASWVNGIIWDVTERKRAERELRESENRYRTLFANVTEGLLVADLETRRFCFANSAVCKMFGYTEEEFLRVGVADIHPKEDLNRVLAEFEAQARGNKTVSSDIPCLRKDGTLLREKDQHRERSRAGP